MKSSIIQYLATAVVAAGLTLTAQATSITGGISFSGGPVAVDTGDLATGTTITSFGDVRVASVSGDYTAVAVGISVRISTGFQFKPALIPNPTVDVWVITAPIFAGGANYSFDLSNIQNVSQGVDVNGTHFLSITGTGMLHITGFTDTAGSYLLTATSAASTFSFSSSNAALPDGGATVMLLGAALSGLALIRRKLA
jgi:hypothetical protein